MSLELLGPGPVEPRQQGLVLVPDGAGGLGQHRVDVVDCANLQHQSYLGLDQGLCLDNHISLTMTTISKYSFVFVLICISVPVINISAESCTLHSASIVKVHENNDSNNKV